MNPKVNFRQQETTETVEIDVGTVEEEKNDAGYSVGGTEWHYV